MNEQRVQSTRFEGTVAVWYTCHYQVDTRDWDNVKEFHGPYHPLLGYYRSDDPAILRKHLHWMRRAGVDAIVYDVFSTGQWDLTDIEEDQALPLLLEELRNQEHETRKLKLIIWLEKYLANPTLEQYRYALDYVREHMASEDFYFSYAGRPLVVTYLNGRNGAIDQVEWENEYFTLRRIRPYYSDVWSYVDHYPQRLSRGWMVASPGFDPYLENAYVAKYVREEPDPDYDRIHEESRHLAADRAGGEYFQKQLLRARYGSPDIIFISGWNDWQYANQIEPATEYGFSYVDLAARLLGRQAETEPYRDS
jgi:hypothetical protein